MKGEKILELLQKVSDKKEIVKIAGFDGAIIGYCVKSQRLIYSTKKCIKILEKRLSKTSDVEESAEDYFYSKVYNFEGNKSKDNAIENNIEKKSSSFIFCEDYLFIKEYKNERFRNY